MFRVVVKHNESMGLFEISNKYVSGDGQFFDDGNGPVVPLSYGKLETQSTFSSNALSVSGDNGCSIELIKYDEHEHSALPRVQIIYPHQQCWILIQLQQRGEQRIAYERVITFALQCSRLKTPIDPHTGRVLYTGGDYSSDLLFKTDWFVYEKFSTTFPRFNEFLVRAAELNLNLMISGSSVLRSLSRTKKGGVWGRGNGFVPHDIDMYMHASCDRHRTIRAIDNLIKELYVTEDVFLVRSPYIISWMAFNKDTGSVCAAYQLVLSPCERWEHVFAGYHSDIVCAGYLVRERVFVASTRFAHWKNGPGPTEYNPGGYRTAYFFPDLVSPRYRDRVKDAYGKYGCRHFCVEYVYPFDEIVMQDVARSSPTEAEAIISKCLDPKTAMETSKYNSCDVGPYVAAIMAKDGVQSVGRTLQEVYNGESFRPILETMSCFRKCPTCDNYTMCSAARAALQKGGLCDACYDVEMSKLNDLNKELSRWPGKRAALVTGGRCGIGQELVRLLKEHKISTWYTTRFPSTDDNDSIIQLDLKNPNTWSAAQRVLEAGAANLLVLSASETLHFVGDDEKAATWNKSSPPPEAVDWTGDFVRPNTGVWHKTLEQLSYEEVASPVMANVVGNAKMLAYFLEGVKRRRIMNDRSFYCCVVVTSYEGSFEGEKTPFHPITNATKAALEQIVHTVQAQARFLDCDVVLADPGWVYTEGSFGKVPGPIPIRFGASQILQCLVHPKGGPNINDSNTSDTIKSDVSDTNRPSIDSRPYMYKRRKIDNRDDSCGDVLQDVAVNVKLRPCGHMCAINGLTWITRTCPICKTNVENRVLIDPQISRALLLVAKKYHLSKDILNLVERHANLPLTTIKFNWK